MKTANESLKTANASLKTENASLKRSVDQLLQQEFNDTKEIHIFCPICISYQYNKYMAMLGCGHWLCKEHIPNLKNSCMICRTKIKPNKCIYIRL